MRERFRHFDSYETLRYGITQKQAAFPLKGSLALHTGEDSRSVMDNRLAFRRHFGLEEMHIILANQTHSDRIVTVDTPVTRGWRQAEDAIPDCDALITPLRGVCLGILTADCVPILLFDPQNRIVAAIHAGWKGSAAHIVAKTVHRMQEHYGSLPEHILAGIGPSIRQCCYEVDENVASYFQDMEEVWKKKENGKYMLDLACVNRRQLLNAGLLPEHIETSPACTACETARFFSYRAERCSGRFLSFIAQM